MSLGLTGERANAENIGRECGELSMTVEVVSTLEEAVHHIHNHGRYIIIYHFTKLSVMFIYQQI